MKQTVYTGALLVSLAGALAGVRPAFSQEVAVPVDVQLPLLLKILAYDHALPERAGDEVVIGIMYQQRFRASLAVQQALMELTAGAANARVKNLPVRWVAFEAGHPDDLARFLATDHIDLLYVAPLRAVDVVAVARTSRMHDVVTLTGVPEYVEKGVAVGIGVRDSRPEILINPEAARDGGAQFSAQLLKLARLVKEHV